MVMAKQRTALALVLRMYRLARRRTIDQVVAELGIHRNTMLSWETAKHIPNVLHLIQITAGNEDEVLAILRGIENPGATTWARVLRAEIAVLSSSIGQGRTPTERARVRVLRQVLARVDMLVCTSSSSSS